jgi:membrane-bound transcription factor site-1 protease
MKVLGEASSYPYRSCIIVVFLSVSLFWLRPSTYHPQQQNLNPENVTRLESENETKTNYIIRFKQYKPAKDHRIYLESKVRSGGWGWIERINPATKYPTDFGVLWIEESGKEAVVGEIERLEMVKDVNVEFKYQRVLLGGSFPDGKKRPGKIFTSMSFEEGTESSPMADTSNTTLNWSRHLLAQKTQVTSMFGADHLWKKGYTGAKVKMAIFDTGIRADHPHFRKIKVSLFGETDKP